MLGRRSVFDAFHGTGDLKHRWGSCLIDEVVLSTRPTSLGARNGGDDGADRNIADTPVL